MPSWFKMYLESVTDEEADELWLWFDGGDMLLAVDVLCESHPNMAGFEYQENL